MMIHPEKDNKTSHPVPGTELNVPGTAQSFGGQFVCLNCGEVMIQRQCKVRCARCGYFEDCSDGGNDPSNYVVTKKVDEDIT